MNPHYHPYPDLGSSPHSPSPDNSHGGYPMGGGGGGPHHNGHGPGPGGAPGNPMGVSQMDSQAVGGFHGMNNGAGPVKHCAGCGGKITERFFLHALDRYWHNNCLKCSCCGAMLADIGSSCYTRSGMILCKGDYSRSSNRGAEAEADPIKQQQREAAAIVTEIIKKTRTAPHPTARHLSASSRALSAPIVKEK